MTAVWAALVAIGYGAIALVLGVLRKEFARYHEQLAGLIIVETVVLGGAGVVVISSSATIPVIATAVVSALYFGGRILYLVTKLWQEWIASKERYRSEAAREKSRRDHLAALTSHIRRAEDRFIDLEEAEVARRDRYVLAQIFRLGAGWAVANRDRRRFDIHTKAAPQVPIRSIAARVMLPPGDVWVIVRRLDKAGLATFVHVRVDDEIPSWGGVSITPDGAQQVLFAKSTPSEVVMGDKISAGSGATVVNRSTLVASMNKVESAYGGDAAKAWADIVAEVQRSGDESSKELVNAVSEELQQDSPKRPVIKALFRGIIEGAPAVNSLAEAVLTFSKALGISS